MTDDDQCQWCANPIPKSGPIRFDGEIFCCLKCKTEYQVLISLGRRLETDNVLPFPESRTKDANGE